LYDKGKSTAYGRCFFVAQIIGVGDYHIIRLIEKRTVLTESKGQFLLVIAGVCKVISPERGLQTRSIGLKHQKFILLSCLFINAVEYKIVFALCCLVPKSKRYETGLETSSGRGAGSNLLPPLSCISIVV